MCTKSPCVDLTFTPLQNRTFNVSEYLPSTCADIKQLPQNLYAQQDAHNGKDFVAYSSIYLSVFSTSNPLKTLPIINGLRSFIFSHG
jgi:hypothetical protein